MGTHRGELVRVKQAHNTFDSAAFKAAINARRLERGIRWNVVATEVGISGPAMSRLVTKPADNPSTETLARLLVWLGNTDIGPYLHSVEDSSAAAL